MIKKPRARGGRTAYVDILILRNLVARPAHGYEIKKGVERVLGGAFAINNNVLYPALRRFEEIGAIEKEVVRQEGKPDRHVYRATPVGEEVLREMLKEFPGQAAQREAEFRVRVAFFDLLEREDRVRILEARKKVLEERLAHLPAVSPAAEGAGGAYAASVVGFQRSATKHELAWISALAEAEAGEARDRGGDSDAG